MNASKAPQDPLNNVVVGPLVLVSSPRSSSLCGLPVGGVYSGICIERRAQIYDAKGDYAGTLGTPEKPAAK